MTSGLESRGDVIAVYVHEHGATRLADRVDPAWLSPSATTTLWVDIAEPGDAEFQLLSELFRFHPLSLEDARSALQFPKVEHYPDYLYLVLHGIDAEAAARTFSTRDVDFFLGRNYLVTVHDGRSRSIARLRDACGQHAHILSEGPVALLHRMVDTMVDNYRPVSERIEQHIEALEEQALAGRTPVVRQVLKVKRDLAAMRRILIPQRDAVGRLARREFPAISDEMAFRFRDVYDHLVRLAEEAILFQDRMTGVLEVNLASVSNRLNEIMKVLTVMSTIFLPLTVLTGMWGMNIGLPHFPGGAEAQFWWVGGIMAAIGLAMLALFRLNRWI
jgi:magnesium transporter